MAEICEFEKWFERAEDSFYLAQDKAAQLRAEASELKMRALWVEFLKHYTSCVSFLKKSMAFGPGKGWSDHLIEVQRNDEILNYMFQARNADEHGIRIVANLKAPAVEIGEAVRLEDSIDCQITIVNPLGEAVFFGTVSAVGGQASGSWEGALAPRNVPGYLEMVPVENRGVVYWPPFVVSAQREEAYLYFMEHCASWLSKVMDEARLIRMGNPPAI